MAETCVYNSTTKVWNLAACTADEFLDISGYQ